MTLLALDFETASDCQLTGQNSVGLHNYMTDLSTRALMVAWRWDDDEQIEHADLTNGDRIPPEVRDALLDPHVLKIGFNSQFERLATKFLLGIDTPIKGWRCTMALAYMRSFVGGLGEVGAQVGLPAHLLKDAAGSRLIKLFSQPQKVTKNQPYLWRDRDTDPEDWQQFIDYNIQDVRTEGLIWQKLLPLPLLDSEWELYEADQEINDAGLPIDRRFVTNAAKMATLRKAELIGMMASLTSLPNPNSTAQLIPWLQERGYPFDDLRKLTVKKVLGDNKSGPERIISEAAEAALKLRQQAARTSVKKYDSILRRIEDDTIDPRLRHAFQFAGAQRTNRWSGRGPQPQNLVSTPEALKDDYQKLVAVTEAIRDDDYSLVELLAEEPMAYFAGCVRSSFRAPEGYEFVVCDLSAIESAVIAWLSDCGRMLKVFSDGRDPYKDFGQDLFSVRYEEVTSLQRKLSKPAVLGCLAPDTKVLTQSGWKPIVEVTSSDLVHDGLSWVKHEGLAYQGEREIIRPYGLGVTPEHEILTPNGWVEACQLDQFTPIGEQALSLARGLLKACSGVNVASDTILANALRAAYTETSILTAWKPDALKRVSSAPIQNDIPETARYTASSEPPGKSLIDLLTDITLSRLVVSEETSRTKDTDSVELSVDLRPFTSLWDTCLPCLDTKLLQTRSTVRTITVIMKRETFVSSPTPSTTRTKVYDLTNCGPRNRFVVMTDSGPLIVHNCGFGLGGGKLHEGKRTGLWGYAEGMGTDITLEEAHRQVKVFRTVYEEIPQFWKAMDRAAETATRGDRIATFKGKLKLQRRGRFVTMELPSGRNIFYDQPKMVPMTFAGKPVKKSLRVDGKLIEWEEPGEPYTVDKFTAMGVSQVSKQWGRTPYGGPKIVENAVQATARDILKAGVLRARAFGFTLVATVHDELIALQRKGDNYYTLDALRDCMTFREPWMGDLPLKAEGWVGPLYMKT